MRMNVSACAALLVLVAGCSSSSGGKSVPDPVGTTTVALEFFTIGPNVIDFNNGNVTGGSVADPASCPPGGYELALDQVGNLKACQVIDVGAVSGLGDVTSIPASGYVTSAAGIVGHGYVVKNVEGETWRVYVVDQIQSTGGGLIGLDIKWASI